MSSIETPQYNKEAAEFWGNTPEEQSAMDAQEVEVGKAIDRFTAALGADAVQGTVETKAEVKAALSNLTDTAHGSTSEPKFDSEEFLKEFENRK